MTLTELSIKRPTLIVVLFAFLGVIGIFSYTQLKYELLPKFSPPVITVSTVYPGASPQEVENSVTKIIEDAVSGIDKITDIHSNSQEGLSLITIEFTQDAKIDKSLQEVQRKINESQLLLPKDARAPILSKIALDEIPVLRVGATSNLEAREFYQYIKDQIKPRLAKVKGVGQITLVGGEEREIKINLDHEKLKSFGLSIAGVANIIKASNLDFPTGKVNDNDGQYVVRVAGKFNNLDEVNNITVGKSRTGGDIRLSDIAEIQNGTKDAVSINRVNGTASVGILVLKQSDANSVEVSKYAKEELAKIEKEEASKGVKLTVFQDSSEFTTEASDAVKFDLLLAIFIVAIVMLLFLHSIRNSLIVMISIPVSIITTFGVMYAFGLTFNLMTLLGLSLVIGILVDDSIVVLENIYRFMERGVDKEKAALEGRNEIGFAALSITLVDVVVFLPLALVTGIVGNILREFALVVVTSTMISLLVSFTITPALASRMARLDHYTKDTIWGSIILYFESFQDWLTRNYKALLEKSLKRTWVIATICLLLFVAAFSLPAIGLIGGEFITQTDRGEFAVQLEFEPGSSFASTNLRTLEAEKIIAEIPEVVKMNSIVGASSEGFIGLYANNNSEINVTLTPPKSRKITTDQIGNIIKEKVSVIPGVKVKVSPIGIFGAANQTPIQIVVSGTNFDSVYKYTKIFQDSVAATKGTADIKLSVVEGKPETRVILDRQKMANYGLSVAEVGNTLKIALSGDDDSKFRVGNTEYIIRIALDEFDKAQTDKLERITFMNSKGQVVELNQFATVVRTTGPSKLQRENRNPAVTIYSQVLGRSLGDIAKDFYRIDDHIMKMGNVSVTYLSDIKNMNDSNISLVLALVAAILFVYMIMVALYDSYVYPFVVLFAIPVALIGALLALALTMKTLNIFSVLGIIMLIGLVSKNAILLVDRTNQMVKEGMPLMAALLEAGETRLRPIIMTTIAMIFGMMPIAMSSSSGAEWKTGLAWALIGGLTSSMILTLFIVPAAYLWTTRVIGFFKGIFTKGSKPVERKSELVTE